MAGNLRFIFTIALSTLTVNVSSDFSCPLGFPAPALLDPKDDVTKVHPAHVRYVAAFGDSVTAGFAARGLIPLEFRGLSFSGGAGGDSYHTLQWLLGHYKLPNTPVVTGGASGFHIPTVARSKNPYRFAKHDFLNVAISSSQSNAYSMQLARLKAQSKNLGDGWMVVTVFLGENDVCGPMDGCGTPNQQQGLVDKFRKNVDNLLHGLIAWRKKLYINLFQLFWISSQAKKQSASWRCEAFEAKSHECRCVHSASFNETQKEENARKLDQVTDQMNLVLQDLASKYDLIRPDVGVNVVKAFNREPIPDLSYMSELDCFHPSAKMHQLAAHALWNSMLAPSQPTPFASKAAFVPLCANATARLVTWRDHMHAQTGKSSFNTANPAQYV